MRHASRRFLWKSRFLSSLLALASLRFLGLNQVLRDEADCLLCDVGVAAAAWEPVHVGFAAEPCELALGVVAVALLGLGDGLVPCEFVAQDGGSFRVAK